MEMLKLVLVTCLLGCSCGFNPPDPDWLIDQNTYKSQCLSAGNKLELSNGLIGRVFSLTPDFTTIAYYENHTAKASVLRALSPEAVVSIDGITYFIGGLNSSMTRAYFNYSEFLGDNRPFNHSFHYSGHKILKPVAPYPYTPARHAPDDIVWPPSGVRLDVSFKAPDYAPAGHRQLIITVHYEIYDNIPTMMKWVTISPLTADVPDVRIQLSSVELLAVNQPWAKLNHTVDRSYTPFNTHQGFEWLYVETTWAHGTNIIWDDDAALNDAPGSTEPVVNVTYSTYFPVPLRDVGTLESFRVVQTAIGSSDPERQMLARHRVFRTLVPQIQENPIFFNSIHHNSTYVRPLLDQMEEAGFELMIYGFRSGIRMESDNETFIELIKKDVDYAKARGIEVGGYDLIVWTREPKQEYWRRINPDTGNYAHDACIASGWYDYLHENVVNFMKKAGLTVVETDGPYNGFPCASTYHSHHKSVEDSIYQQTVYQNSLYKTFRQNGFYIHQPDFYFYQGANKRPMGYADRQFQDNPPWRDLSISRQTIHDNLYHKANVMCWMGLELEDGLKNSQLEPLSEHLQEYNFGLGMYFGAGITSTYEGYRLWDTDETKAVVLKWVSFYKRHRSILISDIVHIKRPDMMGLDGFVHVNPKLTEKALAMVYNPTTWFIEQDWQIPLYYAGFASQTVSVSHEDQPPTLETLSNFKQLKVHVKMQPKSITWFTVTDV